MFKFYKIVFIIITTFLTVTKSAISYKDSEILNKFSKWMDKFDVKTKDEFHLSHIFENWISNNKYIDETNSMNLTYILRHNAYSGLNSKEFREMMGFTINQEKEFKGLRGSGIKVVKQQVIYDTMNLPNSVDWITKGAVTNVKDQGQCGSCWSFSTTGSLEGAYGIKYGELISFSEQQLVDCDYGLRLNHGCNGGLMDSAFSWISQNSGLCSEDSYPYISGTTKTNSECKKTCTLVSGSKIDSYTDVTPNSDESMMAALAQQPVSVAIEADQRSFQLYSEGVFSSSCGTNLDHGVLLVGYGTDSEKGLDYYIMKNSWSDSWGQDGYMLMGRGNDPTTGKPYNDGKGQCGVLMEGSYPNL